MFWIKMLTWQNEQGVIVWTVCRDKIKWPLLAEFDCSTFLIVFFFNYYFLLPWCALLPDAGCIEVLFSFLLCLADWETIGGGAEGEGGPTPRFGAEKTFTDVLDNTCGHRRLQSAHFLPSDGTQELPCTMHHEAGPPEQLPTDALSQIDYVHTWNFKMMWTAEIQILNKDTGMIVGLVIAI